MRAQSTTYGDLLNAVILDVQMSCRYLGGCHATVSENSHSLHVGGADNEEKRGSYPVFRRWWR